jgi:hypothetical protein
MLYFSTCGSIVPLVGVEPTLFTELSLKPSVSTSFTIEAFVPKVGFEPTRYKALTPKISMSTSSNTSAFAVEVRVELTNQFPDHRLAVCYITTLPLHY